MLGPADVWIFGHALGEPGEGLGAWHYNGKNWTQEADYTVQGGVALNDGDVWLGHATSAGN